MVKSADEKTGQLRWGVKRRMEFIEFRLFWDGGINRSDLVDAFAVSAPQASNDLTDYKGNASENIEYDLSAKRYTVSASFNPLFAEPNADKYLSQLKQIADNSLQPEDTWLSFVPDVYSVPVPHRRVDPRILKNLVHAIKNKQAIDIVYHSMNKDQKAPAWRQISPHAFGCDGLRWHIRAFCHKDNRFKDFILSRILDVGSFYTSDAHAEQDNMWNETIDVVLVPNPGLSEDKRSLIAMDYGMEDSTLIVSVRKAMLSYFQTMLRLDLAESAKNPQSAPLSIKNKAEFDKGYAEANAGFIKARASTNEEREKQ